MGLLSWPAADSDVMGKSSSEPRWLFPLRRFEEELLDHILTSASCSVPWSSGRRGRDDIGQQYLNEGTGCVPKDRAVRDSALRRFEKLSKNVAGKVRTLKHVFSETHDGRVPEKEMGTSRRDECRKVACNEIVRATLQRHPGSQLPDVFVSTLQAHFDALPVSYAKSGFHSEQVFMHIRLLDQVKLQQMNVPAVHIQSAECSRSSNVSEFSSTSSSPSSSAWEETERGLADEVIDVSFACNSVVSKSALVWVFEHEMIIVRQATVFERKGVSLGVMTIQSVREKTQQEFIRRVIKSAIRKSRFSKFSLALCGCEVPGFTDQRGNRAVCCPEEQPSLSSIEESSMKENYWDEADFNFTSTSFANSSYGYGYPCYRGPSSPGGLFQIMVVEGAAPEIISGEEELGRWLLDSSDLHIEEEVASGSSGAVFRALLKGKVVAVKDLKGLKGGSILEGELRRDVLSISSIDHKNLVPFYGISLDSRHSSCLATVSKFMEGGSLQSLIQRKSGLRLSEILPIARDVAEGLQFLHDHGVVHRNLRSSRVMLESNGTARVGDLGVARLWNGFSEASPGRSDFQWMAPEVFGVDHETASVTVKSDVYSYGMLLWEMLSGQISFDSLSPVQAAVGVSAHGMRPRIPDGTFLPLKCLIEQCWASDPLDRPDFSEVVEVLDMATQEILSRCKA